MKFRTVTLALAAWLFLPIFGNAATLSLSPASGAYPVGSTLSVNIILTPGSGEQVIGADVHYLNYDPAKLQLQDANPTLAGLRITPGTLMASVNFNREMNSGQIAFSQSVTPGSGSYVTAAGTLATATFTVLAAGSTTLSLDYVPGQTSNCNVITASASVLTGVSGANFALSSAGVINGACGAAQGSYAADATSFRTPFCAAGNLSATPAFPAQGGSATWSCNGVNGGTSVGCRASRAAVAVNGVCGAAQGSYTADATSFRTPFCASGNLSATPAFPARGSSSSWSCNGTNGGSNASCQANRTAAAVNGVCGAAQGSYTADATSFRTPFCASGNLSATPVFPARGSSAAWSCNGVNGGTTASCTASRATPDGSNAVCGDAAGAYAPGETQFRNGMCKVGTPDQAPAAILFPPAGSAVTWQCLGSNGGSSAACRAVHLVKRNTLIILDDLNNPVPVLGVQRGNAMTLYAIQNDGSLDPMEEHNQTSGTSIHYAPADYNGDGSAEAAFVEIGRRGIFWNFPGTAGGGVIREKFGTKKDIALSGCYFDGGVKAARAALGGSASIKIAKAKKRIPLKGQKQNRDFACADINGTGSDQLLYTTMIKLSARLRADSKIGSRIVSSDRVLFAVGLDRIVTKIATLTERAHLIAADINADGKAEIGLYTDNGTQLKFLDRTGAVVSTYTIPAARQVVPAELISAGSAAPGTPVVYIAGADGTLSLLNLSTQALQSVSGVDISNARLIGAANTVDINGRR